MKNSTILSKQKGYLKQYTYYHPKKQEAQGPHRSPEPQYP